MSEASSTEPQSPEHRDRSVPTGTLPCAHCSSPVDPLRACRVAIFHDRFYYFCSVECRDAFHPAERDPLRTPRPKVNRNATPRSLAARTVEVARTQVDEHHGSKAALIAVSDELIETPIGRSSEVPGPLVAEPALDWQSNEALPEAHSKVGTTAQDFGAALLIVALVGGVLAIALLLTGEGSVILTARLVVAWVAWGALMAHAATTPRNPVALHPALLLVGPTAALLLATVARIGSQPDTGQLLSLSGVLFVTTTIGLAWAQRGRAPLESERRAISACMEVDAHRVVGDDVTQVLALDLRSGEEIVVGEAEIVPADGTIIAGSADVIPWIMAAETATLGEGDHIVAGARVVRGRIRVVISWTGSDRTWARLVLDDRRRADLHTNTARLGRIIAERGAPIAAGACALLTFASNQSPWQIVASAIVGQSLFSSTILSEIGAWWVSRTVNVALRRGITFRIPEAIDSASRVTAAVFCARGTILLGEPEIASIEAFGNLTPERVLELASGAQNVAAHPTATAVIRAARQRGLRPDAVRSPSYRPGLGVTAIASDGQPLVVGSRGLMLREHVSVALAEQKIGAFEALGQSVLLVAIAGRLAGVIGLQDGLRPGARAAVQHLLDVGVEPILLSGDTRDTCEAIGRTLDIDHVRAEVLPTERGDEIRRLADGGAVTAVIGRSPIDDSALANADVSVSLSTAGSGSSEWQVQLATDDVRDAALALRLAHRCRAETRLALVASLGLSALSALLVALSIIPLALAPALAFLGGAGALLRWQTTRE